MDKTENMNIKFLREEPSDRDEFGVGHQSSANGIKFALKQEDVSVVGLEGNLGSGKSTIIELLKNELSQEGSENEEGAPKYSFFTFDIDRYHQSSIKSSFIRSFSSWLSGNEDLQLSRAQKEEIKESSDKALGKVLDYTRTTNSKLDPFIVVFSVSLFLMVRYIGPAMESLVSTLSLWATMELGRFDTVSFLNVVLGLSFFWLIPIFIIERKGKFSEIVGRNPFKWYRAVWKAPQILKNIRSSAEDNARPHKLNTTLGDLFKRNSTDSIYETIDIEREVGSEDLRKCFKKFMRLIPEKIKIVLVIDNIDRVEGEQVKEIWSDLEIFTSESNQNLKILIPFSERHVSTALAKEDGYPRSSSYGKEYISKKVPVTFRTPPIVAVKWQERFKDYWGQALPDFSGSERCASLISIWKDDEREITPRYLKSFINSLCSTILSGPERDIKTECMAAYILMKSEGNYAIADMISSKDAGEDDGDTNKWRRTVERLEQWTIGSQSWVQQILRIHFQTTLDVAESELIIEPIRTSINDIDAERMLEVSSYLGFDSYFSDEIYDINAEGLVKCYQLLSQLSTFSSKGNDLAQSLIKKVDSKNNILLRIKGYDESYIESLIYLKEANIEYKENVISDWFSKLDRHPIASDNLKVLYSLSNLLEKIPQTVKEPTADFFVDDLWVQKDELSYWDVASYVPSFNLKMKIIEKLKNEDDYESLDFTILEWLNDHLRLGEIHTDNTVNSDKLLGCLKDLPVDSDIPPEAIPYRPGWGDQALSAAIYREVSNSGEDGLNKLINPLIANEIIYGSSNQNIAQKIGEVLQGNEDDMGSLSSYLVHCPSFKSIIDWSYNLNEPKIFDSISDLINMKRVHRLNINQIITHSFEKLVELYNGQPEDLLEWLSGWYRHEKRPRFLLWNEAFLKTLLDVQHRPSLKLLKSSLDEYNSSEDYDFWESLVSKPNRNFEIYLNYLLESDKNIPSETSKNLRNAIKIICVDSGTPSVLDLSWVRRILNVFTETQSNRLCDIFSRFVITKNQAASERCLVIEFFGELITVDFDDKTYAGDFIALMEEVSSQRVADWLDSKFPSSASWIDSRRDEIADIVKDKSDLSFENIEKWLHR